MQAETSRKEALEFLYRDGRYSNISNDINITMPDGIIIQSVPKDTSMDTVERFYKSEDAEKQIVNAEIKREDKCSRHAGTAQTEWAAKKVYSVCMKNPVKIRYR